MGCDIHLFVERKIGSKWKTADTWEPDKYEEDKSRLRVPYGKHFYDGRNYGLFSILADVRNRDELNPIEQPRGLPADCCAAIKHESDSWGCDGHSHSSFTVAELMAYDWTQTAQVHGIIDGPEYWRWSRWDREHQESPRSYCQGISGPNIRIVDMAEGDRLIAEIKESFRNHESRWGNLANAKAEVVFKNVHVQSVWPLPYFRVAGEFLSETLPRLWRLGKPDEVRIVFWFDN
jgi:hypothetical protein